MHEARECLIYFAMQTLAWGICDASSRFVNQAKVMLAVSSGMIYATFSFLIIRHIAEDPHGWGAILGYVCGGGFGTFLGIRASQKIGGE